MCLSWERNTEHELRDINLDAHAARHPFTDGGGIVIMRVRLPLPLNDRHRVITIMFVEHSIIKSCRHLLSLCIARSFLRSHAQKYVQTKTYAGIHKTKGCFVCAHFGSQVVDNVIV